MLATQSMVFGIPFVIKKFHTGSMGSGCLRTSKRELLSSAGFYVCVVFVLGFFFFLYFSVQPEVLRAFSCLHASGSLMAVLTTCSADNQTRAGHMQLCPLCYLSGPVSSAILTHSFRCWWANWFESSRVINTVAFQVTEMLILLGTLLFRGTCPDI